MACLKLNHVLEQGPQSQPNGLCPACQPMFEFIMKSDGGKCEDCLRQPEPHLHTRDQYHANISTCLGCRLISSFFRSDKRNLSKTPARNLRIQARNFGLFKKLDADSFVLCGGGLVVLVDRQQQKTPIGRILANGYPRMTVACRKHASLPPVDVEYPQGRIVPPTVNVDLVKGWIQSCSSNHQQCSSLHRQASVPLRLIDLENFKVVESASNHRYIALSYVWGKDTEPLLTRERLPKFLLNGGIQQVDVPRTIMDAMQFSKAIGYRYMWVDSICIVQDDANDKKMQLPIMGKIYGDADLVIVAAAGDSAHAGLPGVGGNVRKRWQQVERLGPWELITIDPKVSWVVNKTHWNTRGWTFQEAYLARRILFFSKTQVFWICQSMTWREDTHLELQPISSESSGPESLWGSADGYDKYVFSRRCRTKEYCRNVEIFSQRSFKDKNDSLWAYTGILEAQEGSFPQGYIWGVPFEILDAALLWQHSCGGTYQDNTERQLTRGLTADALPYPVPSWAWLSSTHSVTFWTLCGNLVSEVSWLSPVDLKYSYSISIRACAWRQVFKILKKLESPTKTKPATTKHGMIFQHLHFSANTADLEVHVDENAIGSDELPRVKDGTSSLLGLWWKRLFSFDILQRVTFALWHPGKSREDNPRRALIIQASIILAGKRIGRLRIPEDYMRRASKRLGQFVLLSSNTENKADERCIKSSSHLDCGNIIHVQDCDHVISHNVMLIEWQGNIAYRRALGSINKDDWAKVEVQKRNIILG